MSPRLVIIGLVVVWAAAAIWWLRADAIRDHQNERDAAARAARIESMKEARDVEQKIKGLDDAGFVDAIDGLPRRNPH